MVSNLSGLWRYRVGDYRLVCLLKDGDLIILLLNFIKLDEAYLDKNVKLLLKLKEKAKKLS
ncbi:type II toxin-antitoxin system RelE family toxin [Campylobacter concisus]